MIAVRMEGVRKAFPGVQALDGVNLEIACGRIQGLIGENGAGKSTLVKILAGAERPDSGRIAWFGAETQFLSPRASRAAGLAVIYQELELIAELSVAENVFLGREPHRHGWLDRRRMREDAARLLRDLGHELAPAAPVAGLNLAERQLVEIARALAAQARVLLMDEPTAALGDRDRQRLFGVMRRLKEGGVAVVFISHRLEEVLEITDGVTVLRDGRDVLHAATADLDRDRLVAAMAGTQDGESSEPAAAAGEVVLDVRDLRTATGLQGINLALRAGEVAVLTGLAGSGRTRLLRALFAADPLTGGEMRWRGRPVRWVSPAAAAAAGVGFLGEDRRWDGLWPNLEVRSNVSLPALPRFARGALVRRRAEAAAVAAQTAALAVKAASLEAPIRLLSGGNQQKALLARWLLAGARLLLLDEPTRGVDVNGKFEIYRILRQQAAAGRAILVTTSELPEALLIADRMIVLRGGAVAGELRRGEATPERVLQLATP
jgi:ribose transport system ATP-binding protein